MADCLLTGKYEVLDVWIQWQCAGMEDVDIGVFTILTHRTNTSSGRAHPRPLCTVQGVTRVSELRIQCIVVWHRAKYTVSTHGDNGSDCNTSLMMSYPWHHLLALGTSHSLNESPNSRAEQCVDCSCHCNNSRLGWAQSLNRVDWYLPGTSSLCICV